MFTPKKDILNHSKRRVLNQVCCAMGGRAAEEIEIGDVTSGAAGDIRMATNIARSMVCDWGMSELGMISFGDKQDQVFLGKELSRAQNYSEETAQKIDYAIKEIIDIQYTRAKKILNDNIDALHTSAAALLEHETIEGKHIHEILDKGKIISPIIKSIPLSQERNKEEDSKKEQEGEGKSKKDDLGHDPEPVGVPAWCSPEKDFFLLRYYFQFIYINMSRHPSFKPPGGIAVKRNVLKRFERVELLRKRGQWKEGDRVVSLVKTKPEE